MEDNANAGHGSHGDVAADDAASPAPFSRNYQRTALILLTLVYVFNFVDRQILNILAEPIKQELGLSDAQLGLVTGLAFAIFYSSLGLPIARYAERGDRPKLIAGALTLWSLFTIFCGMAGNFLQLLLARLGVGVGEAGGVPPSHSLITEFTPREKRGLALAIFSTGLPLGSFIGLAFGGLAADALGWRMAFVLAGVPGVIIAVLCLLLLKEPRRGQPRKTLADGDRLWPSLKSFARKPTYLAMLAGGSLQAMVIYGLSAFLASYFLRAHGAVLANMAEGFGLQPLGFLGLVFGLAVGLAGAVGTFGAGWLSDRLNVHDFRGYATVPAVAAFVAVPAFSIVFLSPSVPVAFAALAVGMAMINSYFGPMHASCQSIVGPSQRATISALTLVVINLVGLGLGPPLAGVMSDIMHLGMGMEDAQALRMALIAITAISALAGLAFWQARRTIDADIVS